jgi:uncharacterized membrane protein
MKRKLVLVLMMCLIMYSAMAASLWASLYKYQDLSLQGLSLTRVGPNPDYLKAINDSCWIVGSYYDAATIAYRPYVWRPGVGRTSLPLGTNYQGYANGLNNAGQIVGEVYISLSTLMPHYPCVWATPADNPTNLFVFDSTKDSNAVGINDSGHIAGDLYFDSPTIVRAARWVNPLDEPANLFPPGVSGTSTGKSINNANEVAGTGKNLLNHDSACLWDAAGLPQQLVTLPPGGYFSYGNAVNNHGNVVGKADLTPGLGTGHAFFWESKTDVAQDICPADYESDPAGISDTNEVVGYVFSMLPPLKSPVFYWTPSGGQKDLNQMVVNLPAGVTLQTANAISRRGFITGWDSQGHPYLLTPVTSIPGINMLLLD